MAQGSGFWGLAFLLCSRLLRVRPGVVIGLLLLLNSCVAPWPGFVLSLSWV